ncbi:MAG: TIGR03960 family B12-binding radical SAM protein [Synergistaceae bacterium]|nr:TIGR03960 family B12-binding radical SAM protein [Synergistaceae bacterium]
MWPLLADIKRSSRYAGCEYGQIPAKDGEAVRFCLAFPDVYEIGMSYLGFQILYYLLKGLEHSDADRVYCPWTDLEEKIRLSGGTLASIEGGVPLNRFDVVGFTLQYELSYSNILTMLDLGRIPILSADRGDDDPLVAAGGVGAFAPEPLAPFIDFFCVGDGEVLLPKVTDVLFKARGRSREYKLASLAGIGGIYVPSLVECEYGPGGVSFRPRRGGGLSLPVRRASVESMDEAFLPEMLLVPSAGIVHDRVTVEIFRGCARGCRFCQAGMVGRPVRERSPGPLADRIVSLVDRTGWEEVGLLSLASCDYSGIEELVERLSPELESRNVKLGLPSLRMDAFSVNLAAGMGGMRRGGITFAPEAGTQRLRDVINKGVTEEDFESALRTAFSRGWDRVKLYFMMGLPTEIYDDLDGIVRLSRLAYSIGREYKKRTQVAVSLAGFVPKPHTPFQWEEQLPVEELRERGRHVKNSLSEGRRRITLKYHEPEQTFLEGVFARGDRRLAPVLLEAWRAGARFDGWSESFSLPTWMEAFDQAGVDPYWYVSRDRPEDEGLPWDHIHAGVDRDFLWRERLRSRQGILSPDCRVDGECSYAGENCQFCGACFRPAGASDG